MERKAKVTQDAVNAACAQLQAANKNATVNAVIAITGGSFSTVGALVKVWKAEQAAQTAPVIAMPETITQAMHKAAADIWAAASTLAGETIERIQKETGEAITKANTELSEYAGEISRLENEIEQAQKAAKDNEQRLSATTTQITSLSTEKTALETRLDDRDSELARLRSDYDKLQAELLAIAKRK